MRRCIRLHASSARMRSIFFLNDPRPPTIYTLSLHDALPICRCAHSVAWRHRQKGRRDRRPADHQRSEEHTSELQSQSNLVCRLLLEKKNCLHCPSSPARIRPKPTSTPPLPPYTTTPVDPPAC